MTPVEIISGESAVFEVIFSATAVRSRFIPIFIRLTWLFLLCDSLVFARDWFVFLLGGAARCALATESLDRDDVHFDHLDIIISLGRILPRFDWNWSARHPGPIFTNSPADTSLATRFNVIEDQPLESVYQSITQRQ